MYKPFYLFILYSLIMYVSNMEHQKTYKVHLSQLNCLYGQVMKCYLNTGQIRCFSSLE